MMIIYHELLHAVFQFVIENIDVHYITKAPIPIRIPLITLKSLDSKYEYLIKVNKYRALIFIFIFIERYTEHLVFWFQRRKWKLAFM